MELIDAQKLAESLMRGWGLVDEGWRFEFDSSRERFGVCRRGKKVISLSRLLVELNGREEVEDVIRHEIAHALAPPRSHHDAAWVEKCMLVGARPERCYSQARVTTPEPLWKGTCPVCGEVARRHALYKEARRMACLACCNRCNGGQWSEVFLFVWEKTR